jgi:hypothetical protein
MRGAISRGERDMNEWISGHNWNSSQLSAPHECGVKQRIRAGFLLKPTTIRAMPRSKHEALAMLSFFKRSCVYSMRHDG